MTKMWVGLFLGLVSFFLFMAIGEGGRLAAAFVSVAVFLFVSQLLLSRGHADAHRKDWRIMLALAAPLMAATCLMVLLERREVILAQGPVILFALVGTTVVLRWHRGTSGERRVERRRRPRGRPRPTG